MYTDVFPELRLGPMSPEQLARALLDLEILTIDQLSTLAEAVRCLGAQSRMPKHMIA